MCGCFKSMLDDDGSSCIMARIRPTKDGAWGRENDRGGASSFRFVTAIQHCMRGVGRWDTVKDCMCSRISCTWLRQNTGEVRRDIRHSSRSQLLLLQDTFVILSQLTCRSNPSYTPCLRRSLYRSRACLMPSWTDNAALFTDPVSTAKCWP